MDSWNNRYEANPHYYGKKPNEFFKKYIENTGFKGRLLLPGEGEGRNAVFAAQKGWQVDAFDLSDVAREHALELAKNSQVKINYEILDVASYSPKFDFYNMVALLYFHIPRELRHDFSKKLFTSLQIGAKILIEVFSEGNAKRNTFGPKEQNLLYAKDNLLEDFRCFRPELIEEATIKLDEGIGHAGEADVIRFVGRK